MDMILLGLGANLPSPVGPPDKTLRAALDVLADYGAAPVRVSRHYRTAPVPASDQPDFVNAVAELKTDQDPEQLLATLIKIEAHFGRVRTVPNAARTLDLDILDINGLIFSSANLDLPHPRIGERAFVLRPLAEIAPDWRHPISGKSADQMLADLGDEQAVVPID